MTPTPCPVSLPFHELHLHFLPVCTLSLPQDRISAWHDNTNRYAVELREFKQQIVALMETLEKERQGLRNELDNTNTRVERMERELDFLETQNHAPPCVEVDDKLVEQQVRKVKEKNKVKYERLTGKERSFTTCCCRSNIMQRYRTVPGPGKGTHV